VNQESPFIYVGGAIRFSEMSIKLKDESFSLAQPDNLMLAKLIKILFFTQNL
jgi:hypothetical protein